MARTWKIRNEADARAATQGIQSEINRFFNFIEGEIPAVLEEMGSKIMDEAVPLTPMKTGALRASREIEVEKTSGGPRLILSFGNPTQGFSRNPENYAWQTHERKNVSFRYTPGTQWKYLQVPAERISEDAPNFVGDRLARNMQRYK